MKQVEILEAAVGGQVVVVFVDGKQVSGKLLGFDSFTLLLEITRDGKMLRLLTYKGSIRYVVLGGS